MVEFSRRKVYTLRQFPPGQARVRPHETETGPQNMSSSNQIGITIGVGLLRKAMV